MNPTRDELITELLAMPARIADAQASLHEQRLGLVEAQDAHRAAEGRLLLAGAIDGKNAEIREAQLREALRAELAEVRAAEERVMAATWDYEREVNRFRSLRAVAGLMGGEER